MTCESRFKDKPGSDKTLEAKTTLLEGFISGISLISRLLGGKQPLGIQKINPVSVRFIDLILAVASTLRQRFDYDRDTDPDSVFDFDTFACVLLGVSVIFVDSHLLSTRHFSLTT